MKRLILLLLLMPLLSFALKAEEASSAEVEKVYVIFKTHLDVGFTELSSSVTDRYINEFIPKALDLSERFASEGTSERYVWTTGSWLIWKYLTVSDPENRKRMEDAIRRGDFVWNAVPFTVESEAMSDELFESMLIVSKKLDEKFGKTTTAAKMTDVPGHTKGIIAPLSRSGIKFLHVGVNPASQVPAVPEFCRWRDEDGNELILAYQLDYGFGTVLPGGKVAVSINFTGDNHGPHSYYDVKWTYSELRKKYPNAELIPASFNEVAEELVKVKEQLPVVSSEIGDTWIHGYGSAPQRFSRYRALSALYTQWIEEGRIDRYSDEALSFAVDLAMVAEHTHGADVKTLLRNWDKYDVDEFIDARKRIREFQFAEASWKEQDEFIDSAIGHLPESLQNEAYAALAEADAVYVPQMTGAVECDSDSGAWETSLLKDGILNLAGLTYQTLDSESYEDFFQRYLRGKHWWAMADFGKPGLDESCAKAVSVKASAVCTDKKKIKGGVCSVYELAFDSENLSDPRLVPAKIYVEIKEYMGGKKADVALTLISKPAVRLPEAYWFSFTADDILSVIAEKVGRRVDVMDVVERGNRQMHGIDRYVDMITSEGTIRIWSEDAFLFNVGEAQGLNYSTSYPDVKGGVHFNLSNNLWGTNFKMWSEGSITYNFTIELIEN